LCRRETIGLSRDHLDELTATGQERIERLRLVVGDRTRLGPHRFGEVGEQRRVQSIGLGQLARGAPEITDLAWIDDSDGNVANDERCDDGRL